MKKIILLLASLFVVHAYGQDPWKQADAIVAAIGKVEIPTNKTVTLTAKVAKNATKAINDAIRACHKAGGGRVIIPAGEFFTGPITLLSNVDLHLSEGCVLKFSTNPKDYLPFVLSRWEGLDCYNYKPLLYAYQQDNFSITGKGTLDGQANDSSWWPWKGHKNYGWKEGMPSQIHHPNRLPGRDKLEKMAEDNLPIDQRRLLEDDYLRPPFIQTYECKNILIEGITITNAPFWLIHPLLSENITVRGVTMDSHGPNNDGCDPESCNNVLIENCYFNTGDDCIAIKSGRNNDGRRWNRPSQNIVIRNCIMKDGHGGVVIGSEISGNCRNVFAENCQMDSPNLDRVVRIKSNAIRGGNIENVYVRNIEVGACAEAVFRIEMKYEKVNEGKYKPSVKNIVLENITSKSSKYGIFIDGFNKGSEVENILIRNCHFSGIKDPSFNKIVGAKNVRFENSSLSY